LRLLLLFLPVVVLFPVCGCRRSAPDTGESVLYANLGARIRTLDAADISDVSSMVVAAQCCEGLYQYHYLKRPYRIIRNNKNRQRCVFCR